MVAPFNISQQTGIEGLEDFQTSPISLQHPAMGGPDGAAKLIDIPRVGHKVRSLLTWRTPHLGYIQMYINPQNMEINEEKDITSIRTKAGFVIQYAGEKLTEISISGTTGSAGMEGINILDSIYRSEQEAFNGVAEILDQRLRTAQLFALFKGQNAINGLNPSDLLETFTAQIATATTLNIFEQPFPTLASLAASVELSFQGVLYKGYFKNFKVMEKAESPGIFEYSMNFTAYAKQGTRRNFMPWHRQPFAPADIDSNPLSFVGVSSPVSAPRVRDNNTIQPLASTTPTPLPDDTQRVNFAAAGNLSNRRHLSNSLGDNGRSLNDINLEDLI